MTDDTELVLTRIADGVLTITLNRPEKKNALTVAMYEKMAAAVRSGNADVDVRVIHLRGAGGCFTAGNDLMDFMSVPPAGMDSPVIQYLLALTECEKPILVEVSGPAIGIGVTMLLHCDLVYADETARFKMPFVDLALVPEGASSLVLPRTMGHAQASELFFFSEKIDAERALSVGLITGIRPSDLLGSYCEARARELAKKAPAAVKETKALLRKWSRAEIREVIEAEGRVFAKRLESAEAREAFTAFFEKREPDFSKAE